MLSLKLSIIIIQMFAAIFMSLTYFRTKYEFLDICEKNMHLELNKIKISLINTINREKKIKITRKGKDTFRLSVISICIITLILFFNFFNSEYLETYLNISIFYILILLLLMVLIIYWTYLIIKKSELFINILTFRIQKIFLSILYLVSRKSYISGLGFIYLFSSFIFSILSELGNSKLLYFQIFEIIATFYTLIGLAVIMIIINSYYQAKSYKN